MILLAGCKGSSHLAPVEQLDQPPSKRLQHHQVSRGDTLYSISWRYGMDFREIARLNHIAPPYTIYVGQRLNLAEPSAGGGRGAPVMAGPALAEGAYAVRESGGVREVGGGGAVRELPPPQPEPARPVRRPSSPAPASVPETEATPEPATSIPSDAVSSGRWIWPARGPLIGRFMAGNPRQKGIDIAGNTGDPVVASAAGEVVYAGSGLTGYGQLVIIKHDEQYLSAYAHNSRLLVAEGSRVQQGQQIAEMGASETDKTKLHFEIRQAGKPVDPLGFLPGR